MDRMARLRAAAPVLLLAVAVAVVSVVVRRTVFPAYSWNRDEPVYLWQVEVLRSGHLAVTDGDAPMFFRPWLTAARDGQLFSQYTLGWPLMLLVASLLVGSAHAASVLGAVLAVVGTYALARELVRDRVVSFVAAVVLSASPIVVLQSGLHLGYLFTLGLGSIATTCVLAGVRLGRPTRVAVGGLILGAVFITRPYDAVLWGAGAAVSVAVAHGRGAGGGRRAFVRALPMAGWFLLGAAPLVLLTLACNARLTGSVTEFPITAADPLDTMGFGLRRIMPANDPVTFGLIQAVKGSGRNAITTPPFLFGSYLGVVGAAAGLWLRRKERSTLSLLAIGAAFPLGYFFFWGIFLSAAYARYTGPFYYLPLYAPVSILIATALVEAFRRRRAVGAAAVAALVVATIPFAWNQVVHNRRISRSQAPWRAATAPVDGRALVFVADSGPYLLFVNPFSDNQPDLSDRVLFAADRGAANLDLIERHPDRRPYLEVSSVASYDLLDYDDVRTPTISFAPVEVVDGGVVAVRLRVRNVSGRGVVAAHLTIADRTEWRLVAEGSSRGAVHEIEWLVGPDLGAESAGPPIVPLEGPRGTLTVGVGFGDTAADAEASARVRWRYGFRVVGSELEVQTPGKAERSVVTEGVRGWARVTALPELSVDVSRAGGPEATP
jgi:hypothetical protein